MFEAGNLRDTLRQMLALLEGERQALASLDLARIMTCADGKLELCRAIEAQSQGAIDDEAKGLLDAVARLNEVNRKLRNLIAANVENRLDTLTGRTAIYGGARVAAAPRLPR